MLNVCVGVSRSGGVQVSTKHHVPWPGGPPEGLSAQKVLVFEPSTGDPQNEIGVIASRGLTVELLHSGLPGAAGCWSEFPLGCKLCWRCGWGEFLVVK